MAFKKKPEHELARLPDEELIAYLVGARGAGELAEASSALGIFTFRHFEDLVRFALGKVASRDDAEDLAQQTIANILKSAFDGSTVEEARALMYRILRRRIADFYEARERKPPPGVLPEQTDDEDRKAPDAAVSPDDKGVVEVTDVTERILEGLQPHHRRVVELAVYEGYSSKETADIVNREFPNLDTPMTPENVDQIKSRFRKDLREELDDSA